MVTIDNTPSEDAHDPVIAEAQLRLRALGQWKELQEAHQYLNGLGVPWYDEAHAEECDSKPFSLKHRITLLKARREVIIEE